MQYGMALEQHLAYTAHCAEVAVDLERWVSAEHTTVRTTAGNYEKLAFRIDEAKLVVDKPQCHIAVKEPSVHIDFPSKTPTRAAFASKFKRLETCFGKVRRIEWGNLAVRMQSV